MTNHAPTSPDATSMKRADKMSGRAVSHRENMSPQKSGGTGCSELKNFKGSPSGNFLAATTNRTTEAEHSLSFPPISSATAKTCTKCGVLKPAADFYARKSACKTCVRKLAAVYAAVARKDPRVIAMKLADHRRYSATPKGRAAAARAQSRWLAKQPRTQDTKP